MVIDLKTLKGKIFTTDEIAEMARMHRESVRRAIREGRLKATHPPGSRIHYIRGEDFIRYIKGKLPEEADDAR